MEKKEKIDKLIERLIDINKDVGNIYKEKANKFIKKEEALKSKEMKFEVGKWYKHYKYNKSYAKCKNSTDAYYFRMDNLILEGKYNGSGGYSWDLKEIGEEVPLSEIQQYLPDGHVDKFTTAVEPLNEWWKTLKKGDVVRCIANVQKRTSRKFGDEFIIYEDFNGYICYDKLHSSSDFNEFELVRRANEVEKWSVGSYVVFLEDDIQANRYKKGEISSIRIACYSSNILLDNNNENTIDYCVNKIKWFATLQEAEKFSKQLTTNELELVVNKRSVQWSNMYQSSHLLNAYSLEKEVEELPKFKQLKPEFINYFEKEVEDN